ncbi:hypothetical protein HBH76_183630 [Parastagonospora nodorum]|nr:hypothetical protein HBH76_183630 [Parastagonospora nodorum]
MTSETQPSEAHPPYLVVILLPLHFSWDLQSSAALHQGVDQLTHLDPRASATHRTFRTMLPPSNSHSHGLLRAASTKQPQGASPFYIQSTP